MSERGVFAVDRGIWDHPMFQSRAPFSRREAWLWLVSSATWKRKTVFVDRKRVELTRGQLAFSVRFMAEQWGWSKSAVGRFLDTLKTETMIETQAGQSITVITICKYDEYQRVSLPERDTNRDNVGTQAGHSRDKEEDKENKEEVNGGGSARAKLVSDEAQDTADALAAACGFPDPQNCPMGWYGAAAWVQKCFNEGWPAELMITAAKETSQRKRDGPIEHFKYLEKPLAKAIAEHLRPLPKIEIREAETVVSYGTSKIQSGGSLTASLRRDLAALEQSDGIDNTLPASSFLRISN